MSQDVNIADEKITKVGTIYLILFLSFLFVSGKNPTVNCWAAIVQLKNTNDDLSNQMKELRTRVDQERQSAVKVNRERLTEIRRLQRSSVHHKGKSPVEQQLEKENTALKEKLVLLNKVMVLLHTIIM